MLENLLRRTFSLSRHRQAPLLREREAFLDHLQRQGTSPKALTNLASQLLNVIHLLKLDELRDVSIEEIQRAAACWVRRQRSNSRIRSYRFSASSFEYAAKKWLRFHGRLKRPSPPPMRFSEQFNDFVRYMSDEKGLSPHSVQSHCRKTAKFLEWVETRRRLFGRIRVEDVDDYLAMKGTSGWSRRSVAGNADALRAFFRYAATRGWCAAAFADAIQGPRIHKYEGLPSGLDRQQVRLLTQSIKGSKPWALRARAILMLFAVYGLRSSEISQLLLADIDWRAEVFTVNHAKRGGPQRYPLQRDVGNAILRYLQRGRPRCSCQHVFVTLNPPYRPVSIYALWTLMARRLKATGIQCARKGPHILRHAFAARLLQEGASFKQIGDMLGHRSIESVGIYAKVDLQLLRIVAAMDLGGLL